MLMRNRLSALAILAGLAFAGVSVNAQDAARPASRPTGWNIGASCPAGYVAVPSSTGLLTCTNSIANAANATTANTANTANTATIANTATTAGTALSAGSLSGSINASQISGTLSASQVPAQAAAPAAPSGCGGWPGIGNVPNGYTSIWCGVVSTCVNGTIITTGSCDQSGNGGS